MSYVAASAAAACVAAGMGLGWAGWIGSCGQLLQLLRAPTINLVDALICRAVEEKEDEKRGISFLGSLAQKTTLM